MNRKKVLSSVTLATVIGLTVGLAGCGENNNEDNNELHIMTVSSGVDDSQLNGPGTIAQILNEQTGYDVTWSQLSSATDAASAQLLSIFTDKSSSIDAVKVSKAQFYQYMNQGALMDLTEFVNNSTLLKDQIGELGWNLATKDGKIYGIPQKSPTLTNNILMVYRLDWLRDYNAANPDDKIEIPGEDNGYAMTLSDFRDYTKYVGTEKGVDGFVIGKNLAYQEQILPAFGIYGEFTEVDGELVYRTEHPNFQEYVDYIKSLDYRYNTDGASATEPLGAFNAGRCGAARVAFWNGANMESLMEEGKVGTIQALVPDEAADANGHIDKSKVRVIATDSYTYFTVVPVKRDRSVGKKLVDFADKILEPTLFKRAIIGIENVHYEHRDDGLDWPLLDRFGELDIADKYLIGTREEDYSEIWWTRARKNIYSYELTLVAFNNIENIGIKCPIDAMPPVDAYNSYQTGAVAQLTDKLQLLVDQSSPEEVTLAQVNAIYREYKGGEVTEAVNAWYATWSDKEIYNTVEPAF